MLLADGRVLVSNDSGDMAMFSDTTGSQPAGYWMMEGSDAQRSYNLGLNAGDYLVQLPTLFPETLASNSYRNDGLMCRIDRPIPDRLVLNQPRYLTTQHITTKG